MYRSHNQTQDRAQQALTNQAVDLVVAAAGKGWSPYDLLHVLGTASHPILFRAAPRIPARITSPALRKDWLMLAPPKRAPISMPKTKLRAIVDQLAKLPLLRDTELLAGAPGTKSAGGGSKQEKIREKVANLLRKAESTPFEDEADALIAKAQSLQQRYRIDEVLDADQVDCLARRVYIHTPYVKHQATLLGVIAHHNGCATVLVHGKGLASVIGSATDTAHVAQLFDSLNRQCDWYMRSGNGAAEARRRGDTAAYRRSFLLAYAARIGELLDEANFEGLADAANEHSAENGNDAAGRELARRAIPALCGRQVKSEETRNRLFPHLSSMSLSASSWAGVNDGVNAAEKSHLSGDSRGLDGPREVAS
ncbi:hypothetical protein CU043_08295 [Corynebacterium striatum]|nr:hypothetical protein [Corynebacterium striatum]